MRSGVGAICPRCRPPADFFAPRFPSIPVALALLPLALPAPALLPALTAARLVPAFGALACDDFGVDPLFALPFAALFTPLLFLCLGVVPNVDCPNSTPIPSVTDTIRASR